MKDKVMGRVPLVLGHSVERAEVENGKVRLHLRGLDGSKREIVTEHVIAATGYRVNVERLAFLDSGIRSKLKCVNGTPVLSSNFESSVPGLYFVGIAAANSFGPVMRFAFGAGFAAKRITHYCKIARTKTSVRSSVRRCNHHGITKRGSNALLPERARESIVEEAHEARNHRTPRRLRW